MLASSNELHSHNTRQSHLPYAQRHHSTLALRSTWHTATKIYSQIPKYIRDIDNDMKFRKTLKRHLLNECN